MAKILSFPDGLGAAADFLSEDDGTLSFQFGSDGSVSLGEVRAPDRVTRDWSNQELADLFRVQNLLHGAGVPVETTRGLTDEGDPWFIYCHPSSGEVFTHVARIDGSYVLDSPNLLAPLYGSDFQALIDSFLEGPLAARQKDEETRRVVSLRPGTNVRLHPSAMLAALVWTLLIGSDDLILAMPVAAEEKPDEPAAPVFAHGPEIMGESWDDDARPGAAQDEDAHEAAGLVREAACQQTLTLHHNSYAIGLSTIAVAMGLMSETAGLTVDREAAIVLEALASKALSSNEEEAAALAAIEIEIAAEAAAAEIEPEAAAAPASDRGTVVPDSEADPLLVTTLPPLSITPTGPIGAVPAAQPADEEASAGAETGRPVRSASPANEDAKAELILAEMLNQLETTLLESVTVATSFDHFTQSEFDVLMGYLYADDPMAGHRDMESATEAFIRYIQNKDAEVGIVRFGDEIIMIDRTYFETGGETYAVSWETDDGQVVSLIGLRADFEQFDLIA